jgi:hypothetical protein
VLALRDIILGQLAPGKQNLPLRQGENKKLLPLIKTDDSDKSGH